MTISALPTTGPISLQRAITTSGWVDLGDPRLIHFILAGGGGGGGAGSNSTGFGGGGGGGGGGAVAGKLFIGGRVYVHIGAGGTAGAIGSGLVAGDGGNSYLGVPWAQQADMADGSSIYWIGAVGGKGGCGGNSISGGANANAPRASLNTSGLPTLTGYNSANNPPVVTIGCAGSNGGGGGTSGGNGNNGGGIATYYPNTNVSLYPTILQGWANNDMRYFLGSTATTVASNTLGASMFGINWTDLPGNSFNPGASTFTIPFTLWTNGNVDTLGRANGGTGGSTANQPHGAAGQGGWFTGGGGGGASDSSISGAGGGSNLNRGGESGRQFGHTTDRGGGGGAGILRPGADGIVRVNSNTGGKGGDGGLGGGGGGGSQCNSTGVTGGVGGQGALALFW